jgi:hypothetical protein
VPVRHCVILARKPDQALDVLLGDPSLYPPDVTERALPDPASAQRLLATEAPDIAARLAALARRFDADPRALDAALLGTCRIGRRHGSFGVDFHAYHNEAHVLEVGERRLLRLLAGMGKAAPGAADVAALLMFAACHDLRQREARPAHAPVGGNEAASAAEALRILDACGFDRDGDRAQYLALELMIIGSTFDNRPAPDDGLEPELAHTGAGGALARDLANLLDQRRPDWRHDPAAGRGERLARLAADLDTANVGEDFGQLCGTALRLCREREMRAGRRLEAAESAPTCLDFLGRGQEHYFFRLHRFNSREGQQVFGEQKRRNGPEVRRTTAALLGQFGAAPPTRGREVLAAFAALTGAEPPGPG